MMNKVLFSVLAAGLLLAGCGVPTTPVQGPTQATTSNGSYHVQSYYGYKPYYNNYYYKPYYPKRYYY